jgi:ABC-type multidrug transport system fused ATPase/permease subunit
MQNRPLITSNRDLRDLIGWMSPRRKRQLALMLLLMVAGAAAEMIAIGAVLPFLQLLVAPDAMLAEPRLAGMRASLGWRTASDLVMPAALLLIASAILAAGVRLLLAWAGQRFIYRLGYDMDVELFRRTVRQPYGHYVNQSSHEILAGFDKINMLVNTVLMPVMIGTASAVIAVFITLLLIAIDPFTAAVTTAAMGVIYTGISLASRRSLDAISHSRSQLVGARMKAVQQALGGLRDIILDRSQPIHERRFARIDGEYRDMGAHAALLSTAPRFVVEAAGVALIGGLAIWFNGRPGGVIAALPTLGALALGAQRLLPLLQASYQALTQYLTARVSLADVLDLMAGPMIESAALVDTAAPRIFERSIALCDLGFRYAGTGDRGTAALEGIDLVIAKGDRIGLIGQTGSGKSTLVDVVMGLLEPSAGTILLDDVPLTPDRVGHWQAQIAHVPQTVFLLDDSVAANIAFADTIDMDRVAQAAARAQLDDVIAALPEGYATLVGERGIRLSGGQRQRIGIARALYKRADVLILDEATSALDDNTETAIMTAIDGLGRELTIIQIAHRLSTLRGCSTIYRIANGHIVQQGDWNTVVGSQDGTP